MIEAILVFAALIITALLLLLVLNKRRKKTVFIPYTPPDPKNICVDDTPDKPRGFGYKNAWLAIKTADSDAVIKALGLEDIKPANWETGLQAAHDYYMTHVFVSPPVKGWVFVVGIALPQPEDTRNPDRATPFLEKLAGSFKCIRYFITHRVVDFHVWIRVDDGKIVRRYAYLGEAGQTLFDDGEMTPEEEDLEFFFFEDSPPKGKVMSISSGKISGSPNEEDVTDIAGAWSINPVDLEDMDLPPSCGHIGMVVN